MSICKLFCGLAFITTLGAFGAACTVDHPTANTIVNQNTGGDGGGDTTVIVECKDNCEKTRVTCVAACADDACKATCTVDKDKCDSDCK